MRQYIFVKFRPGDTRTYTYHNDGEPVAKGDRVKVAGRRDDGWQAVTVEGVHPPGYSPPFTTKPILGKVDPPPAEDLFGEPPSRSDFPRDELNNEFGDRS